MDNINRIEAGELSCTPYIYSQEHIGYFIKYDNDLRGVMEVMNPDCIDVINNRFLVAYKEAPMSDNPEGFFAYGYNNLPKVYGLMDVAGVEDIGAFAVRRLPGLALDGRDVIVGFVDTGIDYRNPVFMDQQGKTRIDYIWDQNQESYGVGTPVFGYGGEFSREDINRANASDNPYQIVPPRDEAGHGTYMASIVAGRESLEENFSGVAPGASVIMVKLKPVTRPLREFYYVGEDKSCYSETDIAQGIRYLINKAVLLAKPLVICLGLGTNQGGHNGDSNLELYIDMLSGLRGICFVAPAGNELGSRHHYSGNIMATQRIDRDLEGGQPDNPSGTFQLHENIDIVEMNVGTDVPGFTLEIWGNAPGLLRVVIESPSGELLNTIVPNNTGGTSGDFIFEGSTVFVENIVVESQSGDQLIFCRFSNPAQGIWKINVEETENQLGGGFNLWLPITEFLGDEVTLLKPRPDITITSPGNSSGVITSATFNNRNGSIYVESSRGFTRKGRIKPDITAPGVNIKGAFATGSGQALYINKSGSSVATAFTAGAAALILQWGIVKRNNLGINTEIIKQMLIRGAGRENNIEYPNNIWGWGTLDILQTFQNMRQ